MPVQASPQIVSELAPTGVLRAAIQASGLSLNRIQFRLQERGLMVSSATLSYWQSGRRRPTRQESVLVVRTLEDVLRVPEGTLTGLLEPPGARRRPGPRPGARVEALWRDPPTAEAVREHLSGGWEAGLARISVHDRYEVAHDLSHCSRTRWIIAVVPRST